MPFYLENGLPCALDAFHAVLGAIGLSQLLLQAQHPVPRQRPANGMCSTAERRTAQPGYLADPNQNVSGQDWRFLPAGNQLTV